MTTQKLQKICQL